jgi:hypothetical protein
MSVNDASRIITDNTRVSLTDDSRGVTYDLTMFIVQGLYSQHFIFFATYEWAYKMKCLPNNPSVI